MKLIEIKSLDIPEIKVIRFARFVDDRGYFAESFRRSDMKKIDIFEDMEFVQQNESYSKENVARGMHFQWNPYMGKLVRTIYGRMVDMFIDIRKGSPTQGKIGMYDMPRTNDNNYDEWIWIPPGFAHGNYFTENTIIEYLCTGEYSQGCEAGISMYSNDLDYSLCDKKLKEEFDNINDKFVITDKDRNAIELRDWFDDERSDNFIYGKI